MTFDGRLILVLVWLHHDDRHATVEYHHCDAVATRLDVHGCPCTDCRRQTFHPRVATLNGHACRRMGLESDRTLPVVFGRPPLVIGLLHLRSDDLRR